jgi:hypothetical protein
MKRPDGLAPGTAGLGLAWFGGLAIAHLTGATPVVLVLAAGAVAAAFAAGAGWWTVRRAVVRGVVLPARATAGEPVPLAVVLDGPARRCWLDVRHAGSTVAVGAAEGPLEAIFARRGEVAELDIALRSAGSAGLVWWRRTARVQIDPLIVAPPPIAGPIAIERRLAPLDGEHSGRAGAVAGDTDGVRPWQEGDSERYVHWASTFRTGELVVHDRRQPADRRTLVRAMPGTSDPDAEAAAALHALQVSLRAGEEVWAALGAAEPTRIASPDAAAHWAASVDLGAVPDRPPGVGERMLAFFQRRVEPEATARVAARWWGGAATLVALLMLGSALGYGAGVDLLAAAGVIAGTVVSARTVASGGELPGWVRAVVAAGALVSMAGVAAASGRLDGLLAVLRGPLPQLLMVLIVLHGFECRDRRTIRVSLGISAVVMMYASGFRVDNTLGWWLLAWAVCFAASIALLARPTARPAAAGRSGRPTWAPHRAWAGPVGAGAVGAAATLGLLAVVPVPDGPARLTLPTLIERELPVGSPGALAGPDGTPRLDGDTGDGTRSRTPVAGDYTGFAESLDTNVRGALSDEVVMRVRAPEPDFWRGQTFSTFDGRVWHADDELGDLHEGPQIDVPPAFGDPRRDAGGRYELDRERFVQTFFVEADMPNVVFAAYQPDEVIVDGGVWTRDDGALRASTTFAEGAIYTVVSHRRAVTAEHLRLSGDVAERLTPIGREAFARYLTVPESTTNETLALAGRLATDAATTYDLVRAYEAWLAGNVEYDLDAPLPAAGEDAVDELLFGSRRGFCEQIATALVVMLRTQGVPARLATGYLPGERDRVAGVWEVRGRDAHAWAEVWFPEIGWQAFDPTAEVPLAGDAAIESVGADLLAGISGYVAEHRSTVAATAAIALGGLAAWRALAELRRRHRRGRWGLLQDRFIAAAARGGVPDGATNRRRAEVWNAGDDAALARLAAERLDAAAFDPAWRDDDGDYADTRKLVEALGRPPR